MRALDTGETVTAGVTAEGQIVGTAAYMSPEQILGKDVDARSDLFTFGIIFYELLAGQHPWPRASTIDILHAILHDTPPELAGNALAPVVWRCLAKRPEERFQSAAEIQVALERAKTGPAPARVEREPAIAVLSFANLSADKENDYFGDGLAEEIITVLTHLPGIKVAGRTSSLFFRGKDVALSEIASRLNVEYVLQGSVRKAGSRIRVTAQLIKASDGFHLWSERFDRELTDIFAIQDEITQSITEVLRVKLAPQAKDRRRHEPNLRAYDAYLKARTHWFKGTLESQTIFKESVDRAIELDPGFAQPYVLLGGHYSMLAHLGIRPAREVIPLARAAEEAALRLDPSVPEAQALLAVWAGTFSYDWNEAERLWRLAMASSPNSRDIRFWYGNHHLMAIGRAREAVEAMEWGLEGDPLNLLYRHALGRGLWHAGRLRDAETELRKVLELDEKFPLALGVLGSVCAHQGRYEEALSLTERVYRLTPWANVIAGQLAGLLVRTGAPALADVLLDQLRPGQAYGAPTGMSLYHAICGEFERAAEWAGRSIDERYPELVKILGPWLRPTTYWTLLAKRMSLIT
jgi:serine/threonine-protein kinase